MIFRQITQADSELYLNLIHDAYQSVEQMGIHFAAATADLDTIKKHIDSNGVYAVQKSGKVMSTLSIRFPWGNNPGPYGLPHLGWFATDPEHKGEGFGRLLMEWVERSILIEQLKLPAVTLGTAESHPWLIKVYKQHGYREIGQANLGHGHTTIYLEKVLDQGRYEDWQKRNKK
ncbi:GNAT family N-acetyltransferase [Zophobihabitans entericus]|uniref:GNAT family N-acetyltransferase n=1 Tax=Zophobihabitans entericus TaxID=1635327 RepID=A0A6G9IAG9_9GAMM|nr:GNAT family N-acetyltransferase [Zophobihabitans entericus]QIQ21228.1 GNAT family N-acetyltransferase [Zophobihabitans entericus]